MFPGERRISLFLCDIFLPNERLVAFFLYFVPPFFSLSLNFFLSPLKTRNPGFIVVSAFRSFFNLKNFQKK
jgi:hypothetical protein